MDKYIVRQRQVEAPDITTHQGPLIPCGRWWGATTTPFGIFIIAEFRHDPGYSLVAIHWSKGYRPATAGNTRHACTDARFFRGIGHQCTWVDCQNHVFGHENLDAIAQPCHPASEFESKVWYNIDVPSSTTTSDSNRESASHFLVAHWRANRTG